MTETDGAQWRIPAAWETVFFGVSALCLGGGMVAALTGTGTVANGMWVGAALIGLGHSTVTLAQAVRRREPSVDVIAWLALVGALLTGEVFAGAVIAVMLASGVLLEARAAVRARRELRMLVARAPRIARRHTDAGLVEVPVADVMRGERLLVGSGEVVPVDGRLLTMAVLDESALTGEPLPVERQPGDNVRSGVVNAGPPMDMIAIGTADESTYAGVVRLVAEAQASSAPFVRVADRFAVGFVPLTLGLAGLAWAVTGDPVRAVAVLVVATPCPLLLAVPIAIMSGLSRAARTGVVIKGGGALERLAAGRVLLFDKTGTLTRGRPVLVDVITPDQHLAADEVLRLAASLDQASAHVLAAAVVTAARERGFALVEPAQVIERAGYGVEGRVGEHWVRLGKASWVVGGPAPGWVRHARRRAAMDGSLTVFAAVDGVPAGALLLEDPLRPGAPRMIRALRNAGVSRVVLVTGDRADTAETVGRIVGVDAVHAEQDPANKLDIVRAEQSRAATIMAGDGINDAPALAAAGVGVALAARGATVASEAADVVLTSDRVDTLADAILIARRSRRIAWRAVTVGMGASLVAMIAAALGYLPPAAGAVLQEIIDVVAIGIGLCALLPARTHTVPVSAAEIDIARRLYAEHRAVRPVVEQVRVVADSLNVGEVGLEPVHALLDRLESDLLPHERAEEAELLPIMARALGGLDPIGAISRTHAEIEHQVVRLRHLVDDLSGSRPEPEDLVDLRRLLYGLYAILRLHNAQEEEAAFSLFPEPAVPSNAIRVPR